MIQQPIPHFFMEGVEAYSFPATFRMLMQDVRQCRCFHATKLQVRKLLHITVFRYFYIPEFRYKGIPEFRDGGVKKPHLL